MKHLIETLTRTKQGKTIVILAIVGIVTISVAAYVSALNTSQSQEGLVPPETYSTDPIPTTALVSPEPFTGQSSSEQHAQEQAAIQNAYPWYDKLPLQQENYFVYFDAKTATFVGLLYPKTASSVPVDAQVEKMKAQIQHQLEEMDIPWKSYHFNWKVTAE